ncbi:MAG: tetratricopeptide repeat protein [Phycisphaerales bacterium]
MPHDTAFSDDSSGPPARRGRWLAIAAGAAMVVLMTFAVGGVAWVFRTPAGGAVSPASASPGTDAADATAAFERAERAFREGDDARAAALSAEGIARFPNDQRLRLTAAKALTALRKPTEAYAQVQAAIAIGPANDPALCSLAGTLATAAGESARAVEHFSEAQRLDSTNARHPLYLAMAQVKTGQETAAMASLLRAIKIDDSIAEAWGTLAELNLKAGNPGPAIEQARRARMLQPGVARWRIREATALKRENRPEEALALVSALAPAERAEPDALRVLVECCGILDKPLLAAEESAAAAVLQESRGPSGAARAADLHGQAAEWFEKAGEREKASEHRARAAAAK